MRGDEIIDVDADPREARRELWRRIGRFGIPLAGVVLIVAAIIGIAFYSYQSNRNDALSLSQDLIETLDQRVRTEVQAYLTPAAHAVRTLAGMLPNDGLSAGGRPLLEKAGDATAPGPTAARFALCRRSRRQLPDGAALARRCAGHQSHRARRG